MKDAIVITLRYDTHATSMLETIQSLIATADEIRKDRPDVIVHIEATLR